MVIEVTLIKDSLYSTTANYLILLNYIHISSSQSDRTLQSSLLITYRTIAITITIMLKKVIDLDSGWVPCSKLKKSSNLWAKLMPA